MIAFCFQSAKQCPIRSSFLTGQCTYTKVDLIQNPHSRSSRFLIKLSFLLGFITAAAVMVSFPHTTFLFPLRWSAREGALYPRVPLVQRKLRHAKRFFPTPTNQQQPRASASLFTSCQFWNEHPKYYEVCSNLTSQLAMVQTERCKMLLS